MKIITVNECLDCPYVQSSKLTGEVAYCRKIGKSIMDLGLIPDWCPLPDAPQEKNACTQCGSEVEKILCPYCSEFPD